MTTLPTRFATARRTVDATSDQASDAAAHGAHSAADQAAPNAIDRAAERPTRPVARVAPQVVATLSLVATAAMCAGYPVVPAPVWLAVLLGISVAAAAIGRGSHDATAPARHLAVEPFAMAVMVAYGLFHTHGLRTHGTLAADLHTSHLGWLAAALALALAALAVACPILAGRHLRRVGLRRGALPLLAALAMTLMACWMLLPR